MSRASIVLLSLLFAADGLDDGVDERPRSEHDLRRLQLRQLATGLGQGAQPVRRRVAGEAALELDQLLQVAGQQRLLEVALDQ